MEENKTNDLTKEEIEMIQKDIETIKKETTLNNEVINKIKNETKEEILKEVTTKQKEQEIIKENEELKNKLAQQEQLTKTKLEELQKKIDSIISSKATTYTDNPFKTISGKPIDALNDDEISKIEEESAKAFFGEAYDRFD